MVTRQESLSWESRIKPFAAVLATLLLTSSSQRFEFKESARQITGQSLVPQTPQQRRYVYQKLNKMLSAADVSGTIIALNPNDYQSVDGLLRGAEKLLSQRQTSATPEQRIAGQQALYNLRHILESDGPSELSAIVYPVAVISDRKMQGSPDFACLALGPIENQSLEEQRTWPNLYLMNNLRFPRTIKPEFQLRVIDSNLGTHKILHEIGHCLEGLRREPQETERQAHLRGEMTGDAFSFLFRIANDEPDIANRLDTIRLQRLTNSIYPASMNSKHNTAPVLDLMNKEIFSGDRADGTNPLADMSIKQLAELADRYARIAIQQIYTPDKSAAEIDANLENESKFVSSLVFGGNSLKYVTFPEKLDTAAGLRILALVESGKCFNPAPDNNIDAGMKELSRRFPEVMQEAKTIFAQEQASRPPISSNCEVVSPSRAINPSRPSSTPVPNIP
jgi:hypothetical protein